MLNNKVTCTAVLRVTLILVSLFVVGTVTGCRRGQTPAPSPPGTSDPVEQTDPTPTEHQVEPNPTATHLPPVDYSTGVGGITWAGMYVDATSYTPGDTITIHASAPDMETVFRLVRLDENWTEVARTDPIHVDLQETYVGSFLEYPTVSLSGRTSFTLEGWFHPTLMGGDPGTSVIAGQIGLSEAAAGIVILPDGRLAGYVSDRADPSLDHLVIGPEIERFKNWLDTWHHLALTYDGSIVQLYVNGALVAEQEQTGPVANVAIPFRVGARAEAPGDQTGVIDGRIDSWALWPKALTETAVAERYQRGLEEDDPQPEDLGAVDLYLSFEGPYPSIEDSSTSGHIGRVVNHGTPGVTGVTINGRGFRLNHDQLVDAGWPVTAEIPIPAELDSGMYAVQALPGPDFSPVVGGNVMSVRAFAIRPAQGAARAPIAVVLPTNTWLAYNYWPAQALDTLIGEGITPLGRRPGLDVARGGNNSAYGDMGDGVSPAFFHGLLRPADTFSPVPPGDQLAGYSVRAPNSMYMVQWLDQAGFDYDVFSDDDFSAGRIRASDYRVLMPHSHHEYWTDGMLDSLTSFLEEGGSVIAPAGNIFTWRSVFDANGVMEVRKFHTFVVLGEADVRSAVDGAFAGRLDRAAACNLSGDSYRELGVVIHMTKPCKDAPYCFGQWEAQNTSHWLWEGSGLSDLDLFGQGRPGSSSTPTFAVGHEADTWLPGMLIPGLAGGFEPVILGEGVNFDPLGNGDSGKVNNLLDDPTFAPSCGNYTQIFGRPLSPAENDVATRSGTILYFKHRGGGRVLVIGASATPWALLSDPALSGLVERGLECFAFGSGCGD